MSSTTTGENIKTIGCSSSSSLFAEYPWKGKVYMCEEIEMYYSTVYSSPIGTLTLVSKKEKLISLWIEGQKHFGILEPGKIMHKDDEPVLQKSKAWLQRYFNGENPNISELPLSPTGSKFRQEVWKILCEIPYGEVTTYGEIAKIMAFLMGKEKMSAQAIGGAVAHNPISIIIPCHRVIGANGNLTGYAGGLDKKVSLLKLEGCKIFNCDYEGLTTGDVGIYSAVP